MFNFEGSVEIPSGAKVVKGIPYAVEKQKVESKPIYFENNPFLFMHSRKGWIYDADLKRVIPLFKPLVVQGGVNNCTSMGKNGVDTAGAEKMFEKRGFTIIKADPDKNGGYGDYVIKHEIAVQNESGNGMRPGFCYLPVWENLIDYGDGIPCVVKIDKKEFARFINCLIDAKVIKQPRIEILEALISKYQGHMERNAANLHNQAVKARYEKDLEIVEHIQNQIDEILGKKKPEVKHAKSA